MSQVIEKMQGSRDTGSMGIDNITPPVRTFHVVVDAVDDDPLAVLAAQVPIGSKFPPPAFRGFTVSHYSIVRHDEPLLYEVTANYAGIAGGFALEGLDALRGWVFTIDQQTNSVETFLDLDDKPVGVPIYTPLTGPPSPNDFQTRDSKGRPIAIGRTEGFRTIGEPRQVSEDVVTLHLSTTRFDYAKWTTVVNAKELVNAVSWVGVPPGHAFFQGVQIAQETVSGSVGGSPSPRYGITASISVSKHKYDPIERLHTYADEDGNESLVRDGRGVVARSFFRFYQSADFGAILQALQA